MNSVLDTASPLFAPVAKLRAERLAILQKVDDIARAPVALEEALATLMASVRKMANDGLSIIHRVAAFNAREPDESKPDREIAGLAIALADPADIEKRARAHLTAITKGGLTSAQRATESANLVKALADLDVKEERTICKIEREGHMIARRVDVDPAVLLRVWDE